MRDGGSEAEVRSKWWAPSITAASAILVIVVVIALVGQRAVPHVVAFNLEGETVSPEEIVQVKIEFSRPMDHKATEEAFSIEPELKGEFSWTPRTVVYTSTRKPKPDVEYTVQVGESSDACGERSRAFSGTFTVRSSDGED